MIAASRVAALAAAALVATAGPVWAAGSDNPTPYGPFGFTTKGLGVTDNYGEPSLAIAPDGRHVVVSTPGGGGVEYRISADDGRTFAKTSTTSASGGGDSELDFLPDGTLVSADLEVTDSDVKVSHDFGRTWDAGRPAGTEQDRQWFAHSPDGRTLYLAYHDFALEAELISTSTDGGKTWTTSPADQIRVNGSDQLTAPGAAKTPRQGDPASLLDQGVNTFSGPMLVDPNGKDQYVLYSISDLQSNANPTAGVPPFGPTRGIVVAHSADAGASWQNRYAVVADPNAADPAAESIDGAIFPWGFLDAKGTVYVVYNSTRGSAGNSHFHQYYIFSKDKGAHWSRPVRLDTGIGVDQGSSLYATGDDVRPGVIDVAWYQSDTTVPSDDNGVWKPHFAQVTGADTASPKITTQAVTPLPNHRGGICLQGILCGIGPGSGDRSLLDFFELAVNPRTGLAEIAFADNANLGGGAGQVVYAKQTRTPATAVARPTPRPVSTRPATRPAAGPGSASGRLPATGLPPLVPVAALVLCGSALLVGRRVFR